MATPVEKTKPKVRTPFEKFSTMIRRAFRTDVGARWIKSHLRDKGLTKMTTYEEFMHKRLFPKHESRSILRKASKRTIIKPPKWRTRVSVGGLAVGAVAMIGLGIMKGMYNASQDIVNQRYINDQRYARNITMMSRVGYTLGSSSMNRFQHTAGLAQALSATRHGRGGY